MSNRIDDTDVAAVVGPENLGRLMDEKESASAELAQRNGHADEPQRPVFEPFGSFRAKHPELRPPLIHGVLRYGEVMNIIAAPKTGKSWLVSDLAVSVAAGLPWLNPSCMPGLPQFKTEPGKVGIIDNELHGETLADRLPRVAEARHISLDAIRDRLFVRSLRGELVDLFGLAELLESVGPNDIDLLILDAFYRLLPSKYSENDNGSMTELYNVLDGIAKRLECSIAVIHHTSKGTQSEKSVTDTGSGAGSQSRAADCHLVLRRHEEENAVVLEAVTRSFKPVDPICLRWNFPVWTPDTKLDPEKLKGRKTPTGRQDLSVTEYVNRYVSNVPTLASDIHNRAAQDGLSMRQSKDMLSKAQSDRLIFTWKQPHEAWKYATQPKPESE